VLSLRRTNSNSTVTLSAALGQRIVLNTSSNLQTWTPLATNVMYSNPITIPDTSSAATRYFRASVP
jgi:hypothetical protein